MADAMITIGNTELPAPTDYTVTLQDLDSESTRRTEAGTLIRDRVRACLLYTSRCV